MLRITSSMMWRLVGRRAAGIQARGAMVASATVALALPSVRGFSSPGSGTAASEGISAIALGNLRHTRTAPRAPLFPSGFEYDVIVVGGGSGGLACARELASLKSKVALFDFVRPSPHGSTWGLGGTCVNVGCIPKKLMHQAALLGQGMHDATEYGWKVPGTPTHDWSTLTSNIHAYIKGTNWSYRTALKDERVEYMNAQARVIDAHTVEFSDGTGGPARRVTATHIVVAVGGRPRYPDNVPGAEEFGITSDDLFWLPEPPGKTLLVGGGYVALECAGLLTHLGFDASVMVRGQALRGFDQEMAEKIVSNMSTSGTTFLRGAQPVRLEAGEVTSESEGVVRRNVKVTWVAPDPASPTHASREHSAYFDTVVFATGRSADTGGLGLEEAGVELEKGTGKVLGYGGTPVSSSGSLGGRRGGLRADFDGSSSSETSSIPSIHAVGDVLAGRPELTPVAIRAGKLLAKRLVHQELSKGAAASSTASLECMDYTLVPTTVFTPLEYGCVGQSEQEAEKEYGVEGIDVYHLQYDTLELSLAHRVGADGMPLPPQCYTKMIVRRADEVVLGLHVLGPSAGEVIQGFAVAIRMGATRGDFEATVGIHPTHAEEVVTLDRTKRSGAAFVKTSC